MDLAKKIRELRVTKGIKQSEMAEKLGVAQSNYSRLESKGNDITFQELLDISKIFNISIIELLGGVASVDNESQKIKERIKKIKELYETYLLYIPVPLGASIYFELAINALRTLNSIEKNDTEFERYYDFLKNELSDKINQVFNNNPPLHSNDNILIDREKKD